MSASLWALSRAQQLAFASEIVLGGVWVSVLGGVSATVLGAAWVRKMDAEWVSVLDTAWVSVLGALLERAWVRRSVRTCRCTHRYSRQIHICQRWAELCSQDSDFAA